MLPQPEPLPKKYDALFNDIDVGRIKVPPFQRSFVWTKEQTADLIDSLIKGYPIGTFILWKTRDFLRQVKNIGNVTLPDTPAGEPVSYVLDGQQRITSLYAVRKGVILTREGEIIDYKDLSINLDLEPSTDDPLVVYDPPPNTRSISVHELLNANVVSLMKKGFSDQQLSRIEVYLNRLKAYDFSTIVISDYPIDVACEIFTRINTGGTVLTLFEIMVARTFDQVRAFDLALEYDLLIDNSGKGGKDLEDAGYDTIPSSTVLQCISAHLSKQARRKDILKLDRSTVIDAWPTVKDGIFAAVDYLRSYMHVPVSLLLPYTTLLVPFTYFFICLNGKKPSPTQGKLLTQYFWWSSLTNRFSSAVETKLGQDILRMDNILAETAPGYRGEEASVGLEALIQRDFRTGDAVCKALLCLYTQFKPRAFDEYDHEVHLDNSWLKQSNSKNYHHFFPKAYLLKQVVPVWKANSILNVTIVDDYLNKNVIKAKAPSEYMRPFKKKNDRIAETMHTHLIDDLDSYGVWTNDYDAFLEQRGRRVLNELQKRLDPKIA
jgi:hypothetical protein